MYAKSHRTTPISSLPVLSEAKTQTKRSLWFSLHFPLHTSIPTQRTSIIHFKKNLPQIINPVLALKASRRLTFRGLARSKNRFAQSLLYFQTMIDLWLGAVATSCVVLLWSLASILDKPLISSWKFHLGNGYVLGRFTLALILSFDEVQYAWHLIFHIVTALTIASLLPLVWFEFTVTRKLARSALAEFVALWRAPVCVLRTPSLPVPLLPAISASTNVAASVVVEEKPSQWTITVDWFGLLSISQDTVLAPGSITICTALPRYAWYTRSLSFLESFVRSFIPAKPPKVIPGVAIHTTALATRLQMSSWLHLLPSNFKYDPLSLTHSSKAVVGKRTFFRLKSLALSASSLPMRTLPVVEKAKASFKLPSRLPSRIIIHQRTKIRPTSK